MASLIVELRKEIPLGHGDVDYEFLGYVQQNIYQDVFPRLTLTPSNAISFETLKEISDYVAATVVHAINHFNANIDEGRIVIRYFTHEHVMTEVN